MMVPKTMTVMVLIKIMVMEMTVMIIEVVEPTTTLNKW